jgi:hypothetical protein
VIPNNVEIRTVERAGGIDRYGQPLVETVYSRLFGRIDHSTRMARTANGDQATISATLWLDNNYELMVKDLVTVESRLKEQYTVFDVQEAQDVFGNIQHRQYRLVKKQQES